MYDKLHSIRSIVPAHCTLIREEYESDHNFVYKKITKTINGNSMLAGKKEADFSKWYASSILRIHGLLQFCQQFLFAQLSGVSGH